MNNTQNFDRSGNKTHRPKNGNVNVEYSPGKEKIKNGKNFKGGEYVDYEEIK